MLQTVNPVIIKNTKKYKKYNSKLQKKYNTEQGKIINKRKIQHTLMDSRFCSLTACLKNEKNTKGQSAICEGLEKYKNNTKIQIAFLDVMEKYKKKHTNTKCIFLYFICIFFVFFFVFLQKKYKKIQKKIRMQLLKNTKYKKIRINNFKNTKYKKNTNPKF